MHRARGVAGLALVLTLGCAPSYHRASPYRYDHAAGAHLEVRANVECKARLDALPAEPPAPPEPAAKTPK